MLLLLQKCIERGEGGGAKAAGRACAHGVTERSKGRGKVVLIRAVTQRVCLGAALLLVRCRARSRTALGRRRRRALLCHVVFSMRIAAAPASSSGWLC